METRKDFDATDRRPKTLCVSLDCDWGVAQVLDPRGGFGYLPTSPYTSSASRLSSKSEADDGKAEILLVL